MAGMGWRACDDGSEADWKVGHLHTATTRRCSPGRGQSLLFRWSVSLADTPHWHTTLTHDASTTLTHHANTPPMQRHTSRLPVQ